MNKIISISYDLKVYENLSKEMKVFELFPKRRYYDDSGVELLYGNIQEYENKKIILKALTNNFEISFDNINNIASLVIFAVPTSVGYTYKGDFTLKLNSFDANEIFVRDFIHINFFDNINKIYLSNYNNYDLEINVFFAGNDNKKKYIFNDVYEKDDDNLIVTFVKKFKTVPDILCLDKDNKVLDVDKYSIVMRDDSFDIVFNEVFKGKIILYYFYKFLLRGHGGDEIIIEHNLNRYPMIFGMKHVDYDYFYLDENRIKIVLNESFTGTIKLI